MNFWITLGSGRCEVLEFGDRDEERKPGGGRRETGRREADEPSLAAVMAVVLGGASGMLGVCGPFTDTANDAFCPFVLEILTLGATTGTTATTYSPNDNVSRLQMAAFLSRTVDAALLRGSRRAGLNQFWTTRAASSLGMTGRGRADPNFVKSDGVDLWVSDDGANAIVRVRGERREGRGNLDIGRTPGDARRDRAGLRGRKHQSRAALHARSRRGGGSRDHGRHHPGSLPAEPDLRRDAGLVRERRRIRFDRHPRRGAPWTVTTVTTGFSGPIGALFDGANVWIADFDADQLVKLDANGGILQTVTVGNGPAYPAFDGTNIWVPNLDNSVSVVRASSGVVLATLTGNGLAVGHQAAFDGRRIVVTADSGVVSLWKAADLSEIGFLSTGALSVPVGACSDGVHFWVVLSGRRSAGAVLMKGKVGRRAVLAGTSALAAVLAGASGLALAVCGPFADTANDGFCPFVREIFFLWSHDRDDARELFPLRQREPPPDGGVSLAHRGPDAPAGEPEGEPRSVLDDDDPPGPGAAGDGLLSSLRQVRRRRPVDLRTTDDLITRVRASDGKFLQNWIGADNPFGADGRDRPDLRHRQPQPGPALRDRPRSERRGSHDRLEHPRGLPQSLAFDGVKIWTGNFSGSVSIVTPGASVPWTATTVTTGFDGSRESSSTARTSGRPIRTPTVFSSSIRPAPSSRP